MTSLALLVLCVQACLVQNAFSQYLGPARYDALLPGTMGPLGTGCSAGYDLGADLITPGITGYPAGPAYGLGAEFIAPGITTFPTAAAYGGTGVGDVAVAGEMPVAGTTLVAGQVPILGAVRFAGELPAAGTVSIAGNCGCGCGSPAFY